MKFRITILAFLLALLAQQAHAIQVSGLYQATVPVLDESASARTPAIKKAFIEVLVKLTGDRTISKRADINTLFERPEGFVQQFRYRQVTDQDEQNSPSLALWVQFDEAALNEGLRNNGVAIWGKERPSIVVWLAYEKNNVRRLVSFDESPEFLNLLHKGASARGLSLLSPLFDLEDSSRISVSDVWGGFKEPIINASNRYQADVVLAGKLVQLSATLWQSDWSAYMDDQTINWSSQAELSDIVLEEGIEELADRIAAQYANTDSTLTETIELRVTDINNVDEYARALSYLESVQSIKSVQVKRVFSNNVLFELVNRGGLTAFEQSVALGKTLNLVSNTEQLTYRLLP